VIETVQKGLKHVDPASSLNRLDLKSSSRTWTNNMYVEVRIKGNLKQDWSDWFEALMISNPSDGETILSGELRDQSALLGLLNRIHGLNLELLSFSQYNNSFPDPSKSQKET